MNTHTSKMLLFFASALLLIVLYSCNSAENSPGEETKEEVKTEISMSDISGTYKMPESSCGFELIISKEKDDYSYNIKGNNGILDIYGKLSVSNNNGTYYVNLTLPDSFSVKTAEGLFQNNTITFQNYGNADNQFTLFEDCEDKYMEFVKN